MKKLLLIITSLMLLLTGCGPKDTGNDDITNEKTKIVVWSTAEELLKFKDGFEAENKDIELDIQVLSNDDYMTKLINTLKSNQNAPDVFTAESDYVKRLINTPFMADLEKAPFEFNRSNTDMWDYVVEVGTNSNNKVKALSWQAAPGGLIYRTDIAKEILNVDSPSQLEELLKSSDGLLKVAESLKNQEIKMFASWEDLLNLYFSNRSSAWVDENKLMFDDKLVEFMELAKVIDTKGYGLNTSPWAGEWFTAVNSDDTFGFVLPTWGYQFVIKSTAEASVGKWGLAEMEVPYIKGGTWMGINEGTDKKEAAWKFLEYVTLNPEAQEKYALESGEYVSLKSVDKKLANEAKDETLDNQNSYEFYNQLMSKGIPDYITEFDGIINELFLANTRAYVEDKVSLDEAIKQFKDDVKSSIPEIIIN